jgi:hypothetical protein
MFGGLIPPIKDVLYGVGGAAGSRFIGKQVYGFLPASIQGESYGVYLARLLGCMAVGLGGKMVLGKAAADKMAVGAFIVLADQIAQQQVYPAIGLGAYVNTYDENSVGAYIPEGVGQYLSPGASLPVSDGVSWHYGEDSMSSLGEVDRLNPNARL